MDSFWSELGKVLLPSIPGVILMLLGFFRLNLKQHEIKADADKLKLQLELDNEKEKVENGKAQREVMLSSMKRADHLQTQVDVMEAAHAKAMAAQDAKIEAQTVTIAKQADDIIKLQSQLNTRKDEAAARTVELEGMSNQLRNLQSRVNMLEAERDELIKTNEIKDAEILDLRATITTLEQRIAAMEHPPVENVLMPNGEVKRVTGTLKPAPTDTFTTAGTVVPPAADAPAAPSELPKAG